MALVVALRPCRNDKSFGVVPLGRGIDALCCARLPGDTATTDSMMDSKTFRTTAGRQLRESSLDTRRHQRVRVSLQGRYMLEDRREFECHTLDMSPGGIALAAPVVPEVGERVVVYLDCLGRIDGSCVRDFGVGFAMSVKATPRRREKIAEQLTWLANQQLLEINDLRTFRRIVPRRILTTVHFDDGREMPARILDLSRSGVALAADCLPSIGSAISVGQTKGHVVRILEQGIAVQFLRLIPFELFDEDIEL